ncbi:MAG: Gfo/Idh/MocA family oxidoreductase [Verrucomicrobiota bacterium]
MNTQPTTRRGFLKTTGLTTAVLGFPTIIPSSALGNADTPPPSERIVMAGIGLGNQGGGDMGNFLGMKDVQYVAVCDVRQSVRDTRKGKVDAQYKTKDCAAYNDYRELLAREDIDAVHVATPDHWHAQIVIDACRAGKDVYCQKPETRNLAEGPLMVAAARRYGRVVSGGSQRVFADYRDTVQKCWGGELGTIKSINVNVGPLPQACNLPAEEVPADIDWERWLGPAPWAPYNSKRCDGNFSTGGNSWRSYSDYSSGGLTDWGAHHFGGATFAVDVRELQPSEVIYHDEGGKKFLTFKYPNGIELTHNMPGKGNLEVVGAAGSYVHAANPKPGEIVKPWVATAPGETRPAKPVPGYSVKGGIFADFINCVKTREKPFRDIELAVNTAVLCHLGMLAYTVQRSLKWDAAKQQFPGDEEANRFLDNARREPWQL